jgi:hypothetical protein
VPKIIKTELIAVIRRLCEAEMIQQETALLVQSMSEKPQTASSETPMRRGTSEEP